MPKIVVEIMPKADLLDPQGKAVNNSLHHKGNERIVNVRVGKRIELHFDSEITDADLFEAREIAEQFLSNDVIEDVVDVRVEA